MSNDLVEKGVSIGYLLFTVPFLPTMNAPSGMSAQSQGQLEPLPIASGLSQSLVLNSVPSPLALPFLRCYFQYQFISIHLSHIVIEGGIAKKGIFQTAEYCPFLKFYVLKLCYFQMKFSKVCNIHSCLLEQRLPRICWQLYSRVILISSNYFITVLYESTQYICYILLQNRAILISINYCSRIIKGFQNVQRLLPYHVGPYCYISVS